MGVARGPARPWIANTFLVVLACVFSMCGANLHEALALRDRGQILAQDMSRYVTAPCLEPRVTAPEVAMFSRGRHYRPSVACTFTVDGNPHEATSEFTLTGTYRGQDEALASAWQWVRVQRPLTAYYDPLSPAHATLSRDVNYSVAKDIVSTIAGLAIALILWIMIVRKIYLRVREWRRKAPPDEPIPSARVV